MDAGTRRAHPTRRSARSRRTSGRTASCEKSQTDKHAATTIPTNAPLSRLSSRQAASHPHPDQTPLALPGMGDRVRAMRVLDDRTEADAGSANIRLRGDRAETDQQRRHAIVAREEPDPTRLRRTAISRQHTARFAATRPATIRLGQQTTGGGPVAPTTANCPVPRAPNSRRSQVPNRARCR